MTKSCARRGVAFGAMTVLAALVLGGCGAASPEPARAMLAGAERSETSSPTRTGPEIDPEIDPEIGPEPADGETPSGGGPWDETATETCDRALGEGGHTQVAQTADASGVTTFWVAGRRWVVCDVADSGESVLLESAPGRPGFDERSLAVSSRALGDGSVRVVAGGRLPWPVDEITYTFPDGHTEGARFVTSADSIAETWWVVAYTPTKGPLVDPRAGADLDPVTISIVGAAAEAFRLPWDEAQRNK